MWHYQFQYLAISKTIRHYILHTTHFRPLHTFLSILFGKSVDCRAVTRDGLHFRCRFHSNLIHRPQFAGKIFMSVVFAITVQSSLLRVKMFKSHSQMFNWPAEILDTKPKQWTKMYHFGVYWLLLKALSVLLWVCVCACVCVCVRACVLLCDYPGVCETDWYVDQCHQWCMKHHQSRELSCNTLVNLIFYKVKYNSISPLSPLHCITSPLKAWNIPAVYNGLEVLVIPEIITKCCGY
jgi:hypothetical protein